MARREAPRDGHFEFGFCANSRAVFGAHGRVAPRDNFTMLKETPKMPWRGATRLKIKKNIFFYRVSRGATREKMHSKNTRREAPRML